LYHHPVEKMKEVIHYWKVEDGDIDDNDPQGIRIKEFEGECAMEGKVEEMVASYYGHPIKTKKHNINIDEAPKIVIIDEYWDKEIVTQVVNLLKEYT